MNNYLQQNLCKIRLLLGFIASSLFFSLANSTFAQIVPDNTLGRENSVVTPNANVRGLPATLIEGGATRGVNLFQSFSKFNVGNGERVYFSNPVGIQNILSRITGGDPSKIFGTLGVNGNANLFFLNPNGILFGPNARLDVAGSFVASTADSFVFENGLKFSATNLEAAPLITVNIRPGLQFGGNQSGNISSTANLNAGEDLTLSGVKLDLEGKLEAARDLTLQATDTVKIRDSVTNPFIASAGGKLVVQGNQNVDIFALNNFNSGFFSGGDMLLRSANTVGGDAHYWAGRNFRIETLNGNLGNLFSPYDPVIRASGDVSFDNYTGASLHILAGGSVTISTVNITGADPTNGLSEQVKLSDGTPLQINGATQATLDIRAGTTDFNPEGNIPNPVTGFVNLTTSNNTPTRADIKIGSILNTQPSNALVFLSNQYKPNSLPGSIQVGPLNNNSFSVSTIGSPVTIDARGDVSIAQGINTGIAAGKGGDIKILSVGDIDILKGDNDFKAGLASVVNDNQNPSMMNEAGNITLISTNGNIQTQGNIGSFSFGGKGGDIILRAKDNITIASEIASRILEKGTGNAGSIQIISDTGDINLNLQDPSALRQITSSTPNGSGGNIELRAQQGIITTTGWNIQAQSGNGVAGKVTVTASGDIRLGNIQASSNNSDDNAGFSKIIIQSNQGSVFLDNSRLSTSNSGSSVAGDISITAANTVSILNSSNSSSEGKFGRIFIGASNDYASFSPKAVVIKNSRLSTTNVVNPQNVPVPNENINAGDISIKAIEQISLTDNSRLDTQTARKGNAGDVSITTNGGTVSLDNKAQIQAQTEGTGNAGNVFIATNGGDLSLDHSANIFSTVNSGATGNAGEINIKAGSVDLKNGAQLLTLVRDQEKFDDEFRKAGNITIKADGAVTLDGIPNTQGLRSSIFSRLGSRSRGEAGKIDITANSVSLNNGAKLDNSTFGNGDAGSVTITANTFEALNGSQVQTNTRINGKAGEIKLIVTDNITLSSFRESNNPDNDSQFYYVDQNNRIPSGLFATTGQSSTGAGGNIVIDPNLVTIKDGARVTVDSKGTGDAGTITLNANRLILSDQGQITGDTNSGKGGGIQLNLRDLLLMRRNSLISTTAGERGAGGDGGNINITSLDNSKPFPFIVAVNGENSDIKANAQTGAGGRININTSGVFGIAALSREQLGNRSPESLPSNDITAISQQGSPALDGQVNINSPDVDLNDDLISLPQNPVDASQLIAQGCGNFVAKRSEFINTGRGGLPPNPDNFNNTDLVWNDTRLTMISTNQQIPNAGNVSPNKSALEQIIPASGWVFNGKGSVTLVSHNSGGNSSLFSANSSSCRMP
ncbi:filamentous hemagglutinin N-terminal domain-containing protein [Nostoc linckia FACHB-104]|nr:filamentous hemagglutinin N-terminal domain-containing protein [Nostoc linckia FACHB-104]